MLAHIGLMINFNGYIICERCEHPTVYQPPMVGRWVVLNVSKQRGQHPITCLRVGVGEFSRNLLTLTYSLSLPSLIPKAIVEMNCFVSLLLFLFLNKDVSKMCFSGFF